jgi:hypothetical protein
VMRKTHRASVRDLERRSMLRHGDGALRNMLALQDATCVPSQNMPEAEPYPSSVHSLTTLNRLPVQASRQ